MTHRETFRGHEIEVRRVENQGIGYPYEFELRIDGEKRLTASELERHGYAGPEDGGKNWTVQLAKQGRKMIVDRKYGEFSL